MATKAELLAQSMEKLKELPLKDVIPNEQNVIVLEHSTTVGDALQTLSRKGILSAPLVVMPGLEDMDTGPMHSDEAAGQALIGWVDVESIVRSFLAYLEEKHGKLPRNMLLLMTHLEKEGPLFADKPLITVTGSEDRGLLYQTQVDTDFLSALRTSFVPAGKPAAHRLAVFDATGTITAVISQLDLIRYLVTKPDLLGPVGNASLELLGMAYREKPLLFVEATLPAVLAYDKMLRGGVSGAPVVAEEGSHGGMIANLSVSDLRNIQSNHFGILALPVGEFLALLHNTSYLGYSQRTSSQAQHPFFANGPITAPPMAVLPAGSPGLPHAMGSPPAGSSLLSAGSGLHRASRDGTSGGGADALPGRRLSHGMSLDAPMSPGTQRQANEIRMISCLPSSTLLEVMRTMADNGIHRVYVVKSQGAPVVQPVGVITPTDILRLLAGTGGPGAPAAAAAAPAGPAATH